MNKARRKELERAIELLEQAKEIIEAVTEEEQEAYDNLPESIQYGERGEAMEEIISDLEYIDIEEITDTLQDIIER